MKRILHLADLHLSASATLGGLPIKNAAGMSLALQDVLQATYQCAQQATALEALDGIVIAGDLFEQSRVSTNELQLGAELLDTLGGMCRASRVLLIDGNHDGNGNHHDTTACTPIGWHPRAILAQEPKVVEYAGLQFGCLPYPRKSALRESGFQGNENAALSDILTTIALGLRAQGAQVLLGHSTAYSAMVGPQPRSIEGDIEIAQAALEAFPTVMLGHIHKRQALKVATTAWYCGSTTCQNQGEAGDPHGGLLWTLDDDGRPLEVSPIDVQMRKWLTFDLHTAADLPAMEPGNVYRVRGELALDQLAMVRDRILEGLAKGFIIQDNLQSIQTSRTRDAEIGDRKLTDAEVFTRTMAAEQVPDEDRADLAGMFAVIQGGCNAAA